MALSFISHVEAQLSKDLRSFCNWSWSCRERILRYSRKSSAKSLTWDDTTSGGDRWYGSKIKVTQGLSLGVPHSPLLQMTRLYIGVPQSPLLQMTRLSRGVPQSPLFTDDETVPWGTPESTVTDDETVPWGTPESSVTDDETVPWGTPRVHCYRWR